MSEANPFMTADAASGGGLGPIFTAQFESNDACCGDGIMPGEDICADGEGGYIHADDGCERIVTKGPPRIDRGETDCPRCYCVHNG